MNTTKLISFDLQGTLSDSSFSDEFWLELLPELHAKKYQIGLNQAKHLLEKNFQSMGKYHELFYNHRMRLDALLPHWELTEIVGKLKNKPRLDTDVLDIIKKIPRHIPTIIFSATTREFIDLELSDAKQYFHQTFSAIDDFHTAGKPPALFQKIANFMNVKTENCLHIGDCREMDAENASKAGWHSYHLNKKQPRNERVTGLENAVMNFLN